MHDLHGRVRRRSLRLLSGHLPGLPDRMVIDIGDVATMDAPAILRTLHTYPLVFADVVLTRRGNESQQTNVDPRRGDLVRPAG